MNERCKMRRFRWIHFVTFAAVTVSSFYVLSILIIAQGLFEKPDGFSKDATENYRLVDLRSLVESELRHLESKVSFQLQLDAHNFLWVQTNNDSDWLKVGQSWSSVFTQFRSRLDSSESLDFNWLTPRSASQLPVDSLHFFEAIATSIVQSKKRLTVVLKDGATFAQFARDPDMLGIFLRWPAVVPNKPLELISSAQGFSNLLNSEIKRQVK